MATHCEEHRDLIQLVQLYMDLICKLRAVKALAEERRSNCIIARSSGIGVATTGTLVMAGGFVLSIVAAPVTLGASLLLGPTLIAGGLAASVAGGLVVGGTAIVYGQLTKNDLEKIRMFEDQIRMLAQRSNKTLEELLIKVDMLVKEGTKPGVAIGYLIRCMILKTNWQEMDIYLLSEECKQFLKEIEVDETIKFKAGRNIAEGVADVTGSGVNASLLIVLALADDFVTLARGAPVVLGVAGRVIAGVGLGVSAFFIAFDIYQLVKFCRTSKAFAEEIGNLIDAYGTVIKNCSALCDLFDQCNKYIC